MKFDASNWIIIKSHPSDISISQNQYTVFELYNILKDGYIVFPEDTNCLDNVQRSMIIENILIGITMMPIYISPLNVDGIWKVFEGGTILKTIRDFIDNQIELTLLEFFSEYNGCRLNSLPNFLYRKLHEAKFTVYSISPSVPPLVRDSIVRRILKS